MGEFKNVVLEYLGVILYEIQPIRVSDAVTVVRRLKYEASVGVKEFCLFQTNFYNLMVESYKKSTVQSNMIFFCWICVLLTAGYFDMLQLYMMGTITYMMFSNLGTRKPGEISAYSVYNRGGRRLLGAFDHEQYENELRRVPQEMLNIDDDVINENYIIAHIDNEE